MRPIKAISFLSLHAAFPSFCLVESGGKKTVVTFRATTLQFYRDFEQRSTRKCNAAVIILPHRPGRNWTAAEEERITPY
ncbi:hypothetical protein CI789_10945 [Erwinia persicina]|nr:hypothetical protein CI789_10945 [Erwinia persicina]